METKKVVVFKGSPRRDGNSAILADRVAAGAMEAGAEVEVFYLHGMEIQPCDGCDFCQDTVEPSCVVEDDMKILYPKIQEAGAIVIASPVYWFTVSAQTKLLMDRWYALGSPGQEGYAFKGKQFGVVMVGEGKDPFDSGAVNAFRTLQDAFNYIEAETVGLIYGSALGAGEIKEKEDVLMEAYELGKTLGSGK